jgi:dTDP-4-dehydrorhamnose 3,5-epimerase
LDSALARSESGLIPSRVLPAARCLLPAEAGNAMLFTETELQGAFIVVPERREDERGFFARTWCEKEAVAHGINPRVAQCNISFNRLTGTLRGMHYQIPPFEEAKLVRCTAGAIFDVIIDLRRDSATFKRHFATVLSADNRTMLYIPEGCAHGFQTLDNNTEVFYQMSQVYAPDCAAGVRWNDPAFGIAWPAGDLIINERDRSYADFVL